MLINSKQFKHYTVLWHINEYHTCDSCYQLATELDRWCFQSVATTESAGMVQWELIGCWFSLSGGIYEYGHAGIEGEGGVVKKVSADQ